MRNPKLIITATVGSLVLCIMGIVVIPHLSEHLKLHMNLQKPVLFMTGLFMVLFFIAYITAIGYFCEQITEKKQKELKVHVKRMSLIALFFAGTFVLFFIICGVLSVVIYGAFSDRYSYEEIKLTIDIITSIMAFLAGPAVLLEMLAISLSNIRFTRALRAGLAGIRIGYFKVFLIQTIALAAGVIVMLALSLTKVEIINVILSIITLTLICAAFTMALFETGMNVYGRSLRR